MLLLNLTADFLKGSLFKSRQNKVELTSLAATVMNVEGHVLACCCIIFFGDEWKKTIESEYLEVIPVS